MSYHSAEKSVSVEVVQGGWILTWIDKTRERRDGFSQTFPTRPEPATSGREIITSQKKLIERVKALT